MNYLLLVSLCFGIPAIILLVLAACFFIREKNKQKNCTQKTTGTIIRYSMMDNDLCLPIAEYFVNGKRYTGKRKWRSYKMVDASWIKSSTAEVNTDKNTLKLRGNSFIRENPMSTLYPIGKQLDVFYNPEKPKQNYVEVIDQKPSVVGLVLLWGGIGIALFGIAAYFVMTYVKP